MACPKPSPPTTGAVASCPRGQSHTRRSLPYCNASLTAVSISSRPKISTTLMGSQASRQSQAHNIKHPLRITIILHGCRYAILNYCSSCDVSKVLPLLNILLFEARSQDILKEVSMQHKQKAAEYRLTNICLFVAITLLFIACGDTDTTNHPTTGNTAPTHSTQSATNQQVASGPIVYTAMGASDAVGVGSTQPGSQGYVPLIGAHLPTGSRVINLGLAVSDYTRRYKKNCR